ncbi:hypothetical protein [Alkalibacillus aidingensis]|uniref:hypothetical protein n=1 Tax=Alkalibacillus aidingensis TaxID=2747607 RepID=UPI001660BCBA|nr:hypothetical protein [Alkalibacillus aidingensis]
MGQFISRWGVLIIGFVLAIIAISLYVDEGNNLNYMVFITFFGLAGIVMGLGIRRARQKK